MSDRDDLIRGLRELADWYEAHPGVPLPSFPTFGHCVMADNDETGGLEVKTLAAALDVEVTVNGNGPRVERSFSAIRFEAWYCTRASMLQYNEMMAAGRAAVEAGAR